MRRWLALAAVAAILAAVALTWHARRAEVVELRVGHLLADELHQPGWCVAEELGYIEEEGFKAVHFEYAHGPEEMLHFAAGELDVAYVGAVPFLRARAKGVDIVAVASSNTEGSALVVSAEIKSVKDLDGKRIGTPGIGTIQNYMLNVVEEKWGVKLERRHYKVTELIKLFEKGEIDGYIAWEPHASRAVYMGIRGAHILLTSRDLLPGHQCCVVAVRGDWIRERPDLVLRIVRWHVKAMKWVNEHPEEAEKVIARYSGLDIELIKMAHRIVKHPYPPYLHLESMKIMLRGLIEAGDLTPEEVGDLDEFLREAVDQSFIEQAVRGLQLELRWLMR